jgi:hypothetical protein
MKLHANWQLQAVTRLARHFGHDWTTYLTDPIAHRALRSPETWDAWRTLADRGCLGHEIIPDGIVSPWCDGRLQHVTATGRFGWQIVTRTCEQIVLTISRPDGPVIEVSVSADFRHRIWSIDWWLFVDGRRQPVYYDMLHAGGCLIPGAGNCDPFEDRHIDYMREILSVALPELDFEVPAVVLSAAAEAVTV